MVQLLALIYQLLSLLLLTLVIVYSRYWPWISIHVSALSLPKFVLSLACLLFLDWPCLIIEHDWPSWTIINHAGSWLITSTILVVYINFHASTGMPQMVPVPPPVQHTSWLNPVKPPLLRRHFVQIASHDEIHIWYGWIVVNYIVLMNKSHKLRKHV